MPNLRLNNIAHFSIYAPMSKQYDTSNTITIFEAGLCVSLYIIYVHVYLALSVHDMCFCVAWMPSHGRSVTNLYASLHVLSFTTWKKLIFKMCRTTLVTFVDAYMLGFYTYDKLAFICYHF